MPTDASSLMLTILMPIYEDWESARLLIQELDVTLDGQEFRANLLLVDDGSSLEAPDPFLSAPLKSFRRVDCLRLRRNLGHQRAIAVGLTRLFEDGSCNAVLVMDADGEDRVEDVPRLVNRFLELGGQDVVFAARTRRSENWTFKLGYHSYRILHWILTGIPVKMGNYSILARSHVSRLVVVSDLWNHYAASVVKSRIPFQTIPTRRGQRLAGKSRLNLIQLILHGLGGIFVFAELVGIRMILAIAIGMVLFLGVLAGIVGGCYGTGTILPGWLSYLAVAILVLTFQALTVAVGLTLAILIKRDTLSFLPIRDSGFFVDSMTAFYVRNS